MSAGNLKHYLCDEIWRLKLSSLPKSRAMRLNALRICVLAIQGFINNKCQLRASALTFYTLLSIVPVVAMLFGIAKGYGFEQHLQQKLRSGLEGHEEVANRIISFSDSMLSNVKGGMIAGVGVAILIWTVISLLGNIERSLNDIWGIHQGRSLFRKFSDYLSLMLVCPFLIIISGSATVFAASSLGGLSSTLHFSETINTLIGFSAKVLPVLISCLVFSFLYSFMPNTKVRIKSALAGGVVAGILYHLLQAGYVVFQIGVSKYNAVYGSFAALPLFLVWLQLSWLLVLLGAEISFAAQNVSNYELDPGDSLSHACKRLHALRVVREVCIAFETGSKAPSDEELSIRLEIPIRTARQILFELVSSGVLSEVVKGVEILPGYQPAMPVERITPIAVVSAMESLGDSRSPQDGSVPKLLANLKSDIERSKYNVPLTRIPS